MKEIELMGDYWTPVPNMQVYFFEYQDSWGTFERTSIKANDYEEAWDKIIKYVGKGATILKVFETVYNGQYLVE